MSAPDDHPPGLTEFFGAAFSAVEAFHGLLAEQGVVRGLIGPREIDRLWERHLVNSGALAVLLPERGTVMDIGSGGGFPGIVLAAMRPDLSMVLVESMERRTLWLAEVAAHLTLSNVEVVRARAEDLIGRRRADAVTARAVAPLTRLVGWTMPLLRPGGELLALKGQRAPEELAEARGAIDSWGGRSREVLTLPTLPGGEPATVVRIVRDREATPVRRSRS